MKCVTYPFWRPAVDRPQVCQGAYRSIFTETRRWVTVRLGLGLVAIIMLTRDRRTRSSSAMGSHAESSDHYKLLQESKRVC